MKWLWSLGKTCGEICDDLYDCKGKWFEMVQETQNSMGFAYYTMFRRSSETGLLISHGKALQQQVPSKPVGGFRFWVGS